MARLELTVTEQIDSQCAQKLMVQLRRHLEVDGPFLFFRKGADPASIPQYIQIIGDFAFWLPIAYAAKVFMKSYFEELGQIAAHATRDGLVALFRKKEVKPLAEVATALADARAENGERIGIVVGLDTPNRHFGTAMLIKPTSVEGIALALAAFVTRANKIAETMRAEVKAGRAPLGSAIITLEENGALTVRWRDKEFVDHERHFS